MPSNYAGKTGPAVLPRGGLFISFGNRLVGSPHLGVRLKIFHLTDNVMVFSTIPEFVFQE
jgi:hypothetical protein